MDMSKNFDIKNPDFAICEITMQSELSDQALIWTIDLTSHGVSGIAISEGKEMQRDFQNRDMRYCDSITAIESRMNLDR